MTQRLKITTHVPLVERPTVAVGDVFGDISALSGNLEAAGIIDDKQNCVAEETDVVLMGDTLFDRGQDDLQIIEFLLKLRQDITDAGGEFHALAGNHEWMGLRLLGGMEYGMPKPRQYLGMLQYDKLANGGRQRNVWAAYYAFDALKFEPARRESFRAALMSTDEGVMAADFLRSLKLSHRSGATLFTHTAPVRSCLEAITDSSHELMQEEFGYLTDALFDTSIPFQPKSWQDLAGHVGKLLNVLNRGVNRADFSKRAIELTALSDSGVRCFVHGHDSRGPSHFKLPNGIEVLNTDRDYFPKSNSRGKHYSIAKLFPDGTVEYEFEC